VPRSPLVGRLDGERPARGLGGIREACLPGPDPGEPVVDNGGLGRATEDDQGSPSRSWTLPRAVRVTALSPVIAIASR
jgi:hypothetical protein